jgi:hypothetical protein
MAIISDEIAQGIFDRMAYIEKNLAAAIEGGTIFYDRVTTAEDPSVELPLGLAAHNVDLAIASGAVPGGEAVVLPVSVADSAAGLESALLRMQYDTAVLDVAAPDVRLGALVSGLTGQQAWSLTCNVNDATGTIIVLATSPAPLSGGVGDLLEITFHARTDEFVPTTFRLDDLSLLACGVATASPTPTPTSVSASPFPPFPQPRVVAAGVPRA